MIDEHSVLGADLAAYAAEALDAPDRARLEAHLSACDACSRAVEEYREALNLLPLALEPVGPPVPARAALLAQARASEGPFAAAPARRVARARPRPLGWRIAWIAAAAAMVLVGLFWAVSGAGPRPSLDVAILASLPGGRMLSLAGTGSPGASARLYVAPGQGRAELAVAGLRPLPPDRIYQLWFARPGLPTITGGVFRVSGNGEASAPVAIPAPLQDVRAIAVTEEPAPGSPGPTGEHLLDWAP